MKKQIANVITYVSQAPIVAIFSFLSLTLITLPQNSCGIVVTSFLFAGLIPITTIHLLSKKDIKSSLRLAREKRKKPFMVGIISYFLGFLLLYLLGAPSIISALMFCYCTNTIVMAIINQFWKISVHASGIAGPVTAVFFHFQSLLFTPLFLLIIPVGWSRLTVKAHTILQVAAGALITIVITWIQLSILIPFL
ncbi:MAG: phosphatase PAP2 family protein [Candidatus Korarchaeota archaeon]|nr:phosphatase PAP2 family protein [Candidatus Korarchaeota archaeon]NIU84900.1 PAP2 family protein [Candidatus Thorarchaeota archaeon]NIW14926.1 PAP2 family protein [Candidatus Thorarchaeota archaeon]NIW52960.1 PAP2 family protein [Candidatus Korarchaeota archaeon]